VAQNNKNMNNKNNNNNFFSNNPLLVFAIFSIVIILIFKSFVNSNDGSLNSVEGMLNSKKVITKKVGYSKIKNLIKKKVLPIKMEQKLFI